MKLDPDQLRQVVIAMAMGSQFIGASVAGTVIGWGIDQSFKSSPFGALIGGILGVVSGGIMLIRYQSRIHK